MHRDIKPSNILMDNHSGIHIIDFGLARRIDPVIDSEEEGIQLAHTMSVNDYDYSFTSIQPIDNSIHTPSLPILQRQLTGHIATRWYRPPEVILLEVSLFNSYYELETLYFCC